MYSKLTLLRKYIHYYRTAYNSKGHGMHSPFVFEFITRVLNNRSSYYAYNEVEALRERLKLNKTVLTVEDMGAGSVTGASRQRTIASIVRNAAKPRKFGQLFFRIVNHYQYTTILELGTSLGISTAYMAKANNQAAVVTLEGSGTVAEKAKANFKELGLQNIRLVEGNFDQTLSKVLETLGKVDMVFVDGNHRKQPTLDYFEQLLPHMEKESLLVFDDIHWSAGMEEAWEFIKSDPRVMLSIDLFFVGLVFFNPAFRVKQHFSIRF